MSFSTTLWRSALSVAILLLCAFAARAEEINPPFGLRWAETTDRIDKLLRGAKANIVAKRQVEGREAWDVEGLVQQGLKRTVFYFVEGQLVEVELQYEFADWDATKYDEFMGQIRRRVEAKFGTGQLIARSKKPEGEVTQTLVGYKWNQNNTSIQLFYFSAESTTQTYRSVSLHYKSS